jgi:hypothetical protein
MGCVYLGHAPGSPRHCHQEGAKYPSTLEKAPGWDSVSSAPEASQVRRFVVGLSNLASATLQEGHLLGEKLLTLSSLNLVHADSTVVNVSVDGSDVLTSPLG